MNRDPIMRYFTCRHANRASLATLELRKSEGFHDFTHGASAANDYVSIDRG